VAVFSAILFAGVAGNSGAIPLEKVAASHGELASAFKWVFIAAAICLGISLICLLAVEERPLHGLMRFAEDAAQ